ncbi:MAG: hypothetical protein ABIP97_07780 [Chthoniobacterales bacterium]
MRIAKASLFLFLIALCSVSIANAITNITHFEAENLLYFDVEVRLKGQVVEIMTDTSGVTTFINFGAKYPKQLFSASIASQELGKFGNLDRYLGKEVEITGKLKTHIGKPNIPLTSQEQIKISE